MYPYTIALARHRHETTIQSRRQRRVRRCRDAVARPNVPRVSAVLARVNTVAPTMTVIVSDGALQ